MMKNKTRVILSGLLLTGLISCRKKQETVNVDSFPVHIQIAATKPLSETITVSGTIKAQNEAVLFSRVPGKLKTYQLKEGDFVDKDQTVALIERDEVGVTYEPAPVPSSLKGVVGKTYLDQGMHVALDTPVALIVDDNRVIAKAEIPERFAGRVRFDQDVTLKVEAYAGREFQGKISKVSPVVSPLTRTASIEVRFNNTDRILKSGMFAELSIVVSQKKTALTVPVSALGSGGSAFVFVVNEGKAEKRDVKVGLQTSNEVEILEGLKAGESVITEGLYGLQHGSPVEIIADAPSLK